MKKADYCNSLTKIYLVGLLLGRILQNVEHKVNIDNSKKLQI